MPPSPSPRVRVAQAGCGYWGPNLLRNLAQIDACTLVAVADGRPERQAFVDERHPGVAVCRDWRELVERDDVEALVVATPAATHFDIALAALDAGKHVLVEKPLATSVPEVEALIAAAERRGVVLMAGHTFLYNDAVAALEDLVTGGELGDIVYMSSKRLNLGQLRSDVNAWWNLAPHDVSIQLHLARGLGLSTVTAMGRAFLQPGIEDFVLANLQWDNGLVGSIEVSWLHPQKVRSMTVVGTKKAAVYDDVADYKITLFERGFDRVPRVGERMDFDDVTSPFTFRKREGQVVMPHVRYREPLHVELTHFLDCIRTGAAPRTGGAHAREVVRALAAAAESLARHSQPVRLRPLSPKR